MRAAEITPGYVQSVCFHAQTIYRAISQVVLRHLRQAYLGGQVASQSAVTGREFAAWSTGPILKDLKLFLPV